MPEPEVTTFEGLTFDQLTEWRRERASAIKSIFTDNTPDGQTQPVLTTPQLEEIRSKRDELDASTPRWSELREADAAFIAAKAMHDQMSAPQRTIAFPGAPDPNGGGGYRPGAIKSLGTMMVESEAYKTHGSHDKNRDKRYAVDLEEFDTAAIKATTISETAGYAPANPRTDIVVLSAVRRPMVQDVIPSTTTTLSDIKYMEETTFESGATPTAEGSPKTQSDIKFTERSVPVQTIPTFFKVTNQQLDDVPTLRGIIDQRGTLMIQLKEEDQIVGGSGTPPELQGFLTAAIQATARGTMPIPDAIYTSFTQIRVTGFAEPTAVIIHPNDWKKVRLMTTSTGDYIWGPPSVQGPETMWGKPAIITTAMTEHTALSGDFQLYAALWRRQGITVAVGMPGDDFTSNMQTIRFDSRLALTIYRNSAFSKSTGL